MPFATVRIQWKRESAGGDLVGAHWNAFAVAQITKRYKGAPLLCRGFGGGGIRQKSPVTRPAWQDRAYNRPLSPPFNVEKHDLARPNISDNKIKFWQALAGTGQIDSFSRVGAHPAETGGV